MFKMQWIATVVLSAVVGAATTTLMLSMPRVSAQPAPALSAADYQEIAQLTNRYAYGIDTCANNGYDYADVFTPDGEFIDKNSDAGFKAGGRVLAKGREALATLIGGVRCRSSQTSDVPNATTQSTATCAATSREPRSVTGRSRSRRCPNA
jgi:hypothetical protein